MADQITMDVSKRKKIIETADKMAQKAGSKDATEYIKKVGKMMSSDDPVEQTEAERQAGDFTANLALLILYQDISGDYDLEKYQWINKFETVNIEAGNSKQFQRLKPTGVDNFMENKFVPETLSLPKEDVYTISFYSTNTTSNNDATLSTYAYRIVKPLTIQHAKWVPYFLSGKLQEFIDKVTSLINTSVFVKDYTVIQNIILKLKSVYSAANTNVGMKKVFDESGLAGTTNISTTVTNIMDVFTKVVFPNIERMQFLSDEYNINLPNETTNSLNSSKRDDILILMNVATYTKLTSGVLANVFNNKLAEVEHFLNKNNIIPVSRLLQVRTSDQEIGLSNQDDLLAENEILVINKNSIKGLSFVDKKESQAWARNMTVQIYYHKWKAYGILPWGQGFVVRTNKLTVMPNV